MTRRNHQSEVEHFYSWEWEEAELAALREHIDAPRWALERPIAIDPDYQPVALRDILRRANAPFAAAKRESLRLAQTERDRVVRVLAETLRKMVASADRELAEPALWTCIGCGRSIRVTPTKPSLYVEHEIPPCPVWVEFARTAFGSNVQQVRP